MNNITSHNKHYLLKQSQKHLKFGTWKLNTDLDHLILSNELCDILYLDNSKKYDLEILSDSIYSEDVNKILELFVDAAQTGIEFKNTFRMEIDGVFKYYSIFCSVEFENQKIAYLYGFIQDITLQEVQNLERKNLISLTEEHVIISQTDLSGNIIYVSQALANISGYTKSELMGENHRILRHPDMPNKTFEELWNTITSGNTWEGEILNLKKDGGFYWVYNYITPIKDHRGKILKYQSVRQDITNKKYIEKISITDALTSLYNRRHFDTMFAKELSHSRRTENRLIFAMLDVDNFKKYNDTYGHQMGDTVLIELSKALQSSFQRSHDLVFRLGGEEFGILFSLKSNDDIFRLVDRARQNIQNLEIAHEKNEAGVVTASFGVIEIQSDYTRLVKEEMDFAYKEADKALYKAKESGRNRVCII